MSADNSRAPFEELTPSEGEFTPLRESPSDTSAANTRESRGTAYYADADLLGLFDSAQSSSSGRVQQRQQPSRSSPAQVGSRPSPPPSDWTGMEPVFPSPSPSPSPPAYFHESSSSPLKSSPYYSSTKGEGEWQSGRYNDEVDEDILGGSRRSKQREYSQAFLSESERVQAGSGASAELQQRRRGDYSGGGAYFGPRTSTLETTAYERYLMEKARGLKKQQEVMNRLQEQGGRFTGSEESEEAIMARLRERVQGISYSPSDRATRSGGQPSQSPNKGDFDREQEGGSEEGEQEIDDGRRAGVDMSSGFGSADAGKVEGDANELSPRKATETTVLLVRTSIDGGGTAGPAFAESEGNARKDVSVPLLGASAPHKPREVDGGKIKPRQPNDLANLEPDKAALGQHSEGKLELGSGVIGGEALRR
jgi:hypothetical protein